jgi:hypothetical protein
MVVRCLATSFTESREHSPTISSVKHISDRAVALAKVCTHANLSSVLNTLAHMTDNLRMNDAGHNTSRGRRIFRVRKLSERERCNKEEVPIIV